MPITVRVKGTKKLQDVMDAIPARVEAAVQEALKREADKMLDQACEDMARQSLAYHLGNIRARRLI